MNIINSRIWMAEAMGFLGLKEIHGPKHNPTIIKWLVGLHAWWHDDETPWCGVFVAQCMAAMGFKLPRFWMRAKAWADWGIDIKRPAYGCIVVFDRKGGGHVGLVAGIDKQGRLMVLGGNQGDQVSIKPFTHDRVVAYRWPAETPIDWRPLPIFDTDAESSTNEA